MKSVIKVSPLFFVMFVIMACLGVLREGIVYFTAVVFHEFAHCEVARKCGYALNKIKLMPYGASLTGAFEAVRPGDEIKIAVAGPLLNLCIAIVCVAGWWVFPSSYFFTNGIVLCNTSLCIFNLLPIFPLDGGRIVLALLSKKMPRQEVYRGLRKVGIVAGAVFLLLFIASTFYSPNPSFGVIAVFIVLSTLVPDKVNSYQRVYGIAFMSERIRRGLQIREIMVDSSRSLLELNRQLNTNYYTIFCIADREYNCKKKISETELEKLCSKHGFNKKISDFM